MRRHESIADACFGTVLLLAAFEGLLMGYGNVEVVYLVGSFFHVSSLVVPFSALLLAALVARWQLVHSRIQWWAYLGVLLPTLWVMFFSHGWFTSGFHDLAEHYFGSHGRFGCQDEHYDTYIFRDTTAPWILHGPIVVATLAHWLYRSPVALARLSAWGRSFVRWSTTYEPRKTAA